MNPPKKVRRNEAEFYVGHLGVARVLLCEVTTTEGRQPIALSQIQVFLLKLAPTIYQKVGRAKISGAGVLGVPPWV
jgi:hypothetical protein